MKIKDLEERVSLVDLVRDYGYPTTRVGKDLRINPCPVTGHMDRFTINVQGNYYNIFNGPGNNSGGSCYKFLTEVVGLSESEAYTELCNRAGVEVEGNDHMTNKTQKNALPAGTDNAQQIKSINHTDIVQWYEQTLKNEDYKKIIQQQVIKRGIEIDSITKYKISVHKENDGLRVIIPILFNGEAKSYTARRTNENQKGKYRKATGVSGYYLNMDYLNQDHDEPIFLTEGEFDAIVLEQMGFKAIALGTAVNAKSFMKSLTAYPKAKDIQFISMMDNDDAGQQVAELLKEYNVPAGTVEQSYKDVNEWYLASMKELYAETQKSDSDIEYVPENLTIYKSLNEQMEEIPVMLEKMKRPYNALDYLRNKFMNDVQELQQFGYLKTGFDNLDAEINALYAGLYVVGGVSSVGKTTFIHQMADQLAEQGEHVIYFSLEQSSMEMVSKSLARHTARNGTTDAVKGIQIRKGEIVVETSETLQNAVIDFSIYADRVSIVEGNFDTNVDTMRKIVDKYIKDNDVKPIVFVDYLQIIPAPTDKRLSDKEKTDYNITQLKRMSRDFNIPVLTISSLNRGNYLAPIDFESFKESGGIEYSADVVWGLQLEVIRSDVFSKQNNIVEKRAYVAKAKQERVRQIELVCLKNRNGNPSFTCKFHYHPQFDFYKSGEVLSDKDIDFKYNTYLDEEDTPAAEPTPKERTGFVVK